MNIDDISCIGFADVLLRANIVVKYECEYMPPTVSTISDDVYTLRGSLVEVRWFNAGLTVLIYFCLEILTLSLLVENVLTGVFAPVASPPSVLVVTLPSTMSSNIG